MPGLAVGAEAGLGAEAGMKKKVKNSLNKRVAQKILSFITISKGLLAIMSTDANTYILRVAMALFQLFLALRNHKNQNLLVIPK